MTASGTGSSEIGRRRRHWSDEDKARIVAECEAPGSSVSMVARRHDLNTNMLFTWRRQFRKRQGGARDSQLEFLVRRLDMELAREGGGSKLHRDVLLRCLAYQLDRTHAVWPPRQSLPRRRLTAFEVARVHDYVHVNLAEDVGIDTLAALVRRSPYDFMRLFKLTTGHTVHQYVTRLRIEVAREKLRNSRAGELSLANLSAELGFADQSHFTRCFKRSMGLTPGRYLSGAGQMPVTSTGDGGASAIGQVRAGGKPLALGFEDFSDSQGDRINIHKNARLTPCSRAELVRRAMEEGQAPKAVATAFGVVTRTVGKWVERFRTEGPQGLLDRSSRPHTLRQPTPAAVIERIAELQRQRWTGDLIAKEVGVSPATVSRLLQRVVSQFESAVLFLSAFPWWQPA